MSLNTCFNFTGTSYFLWAHLFLWPCNPLFYRNSINHPFILLIDDQQKLMTWNFNYECVNFVIINAHILLALKLEYDLVIIGHRSSFQGINTINDWIITIIQTLKKLFTKKWCWVDCYFIWSSLCFYIDGRGVKIMLLLHDTKFMCSCSSSINKRYKYTSYLLLINNIPTQIWFR